MAPTGDQEHREMWSEIRDTKQELAKHLGACEIRHAAVIRRQDETIRDRHLMNVQLDNIKTKMLSLMLTVAGAAIVMLGSTLLQYLMKKMTEDFCYNQRTDTAPTPHAGSNHPRLCGRRDDGRRFQARHRRVASSSRL